MLTILASGDTVGDMVMSLQRICRGNCRVFASALVTSKPALFVGGQS